MNSSPVRSLSRLYLERSSIIRVLKRENLIRRPPDEILALLTQSQALRHMDEFHQRFCAHLLHDPATLYFHGDLACAKLSGYLLVQQTTDDQAHNLAFTRSEGPITSPQLDRYQTLFSRVNIASDRLPNRFQ